MSSYLPTGQTSFAASQAARIAANGEIGGVLRGTLAAAETTALPLLNLFDVVLHASCATGKLVPGMAKVITDRVSPNILGENLSLSTVGDHLGAALRSILAIFLDTPRIFIHPSKATAYYVQRGIASEPTGYAELAKRQWQKLVNYAKPYQREILIGAGVVAGATVLGVAYSYMTSVPVAPTKPVQPQTQPPTPTETPNQTQSQTETPVTQPAQQQAQGQPETPVTQPVQAPTPIPNPVSEEPAAQSLLTEPTSVGVETLGVNTGSDVNAIPSDMGAESQSIETASVEVPTPVTHVSEQRVTTQTQGNDYQLDTKSSLTVVVEEQPTPCPNDGNSTSLVPQAPTSNIRMTVTPTDSRALGTEVAAGNLRNNAYNQLLSTEAAIAFGAAGWTYVQNTATPILGKVRDGVSDLAYNGFAYVGQGIAKHAPTAMSYSAPGFGWIKNGLLDTVVPGVNGIVSGLYNLVAMGVDQGAAWTGQKAIDFYPNSASYVNTAGGYVRLGLGILEGCVSSIWYNYAPSIRGSGRAARDLVAPLFKNLGPDFESMANAQNAPHFYEKASQADLISSGLMATPVALAALASLWGTGKVAKMTGLFGLKRLALCCTKGCVSLPKAPAVNCTVAQFKAYVEALRAHRGHHNDKWMAAVRATAPAYSRLLERPVEPPLVNAAAAAHEAFLNNLAARAFAAIPALPALNADLPTAKQEVTAQIDYLNGTTGALVVDEAAWKTAATEVVQRVIEMQNNDGLPQIAPVPQANETVAEIRIQLNAAQAAVTTIGVVLPVAPDFGVGTLPERKVEIEDYLRDVYDALHAGTVADARLALPAAIAAAQDLGADVNGILIDEHSDLAALQLATETLFVRVNAVLPRAPAFADLNNVQKRAALLSYLSDMYLMIGPANLDAVRAAIGAARQVAADIGVDMNGFVFAQQDEEQIAASVLNLRERVDDHNIPAAQPVALPVLPAVDADVDGNWRALLAQIDALRNHAADNVAAWVGAANEAIGRYNELAGALNPAPAAQVGFDDMVAVDAAKAALQQLGQAIRVARMSETVQAALAEAQRLVALRPQGNKQAWKAEVIRVALTSENLRAIAGAPVLAQNPSVNAVNGWLVNLQAHLQAWQVANLAQA